MNEHIHETKYGTIHYWINIVDVNKLTLVFLPGLTADHRLFEKQLEYFEEKYNVFVWDAPGHGVSWPFVLNFDIMDKAGWLNEILEKENITTPILVGQSMGGYVAQAYAQLFPEKIKGFVAIDSAPLQRKYITKIEIWLLKRMESVYYYYPWKLLLKSGTQGVSTTKYGQELMYEMMMEFDGDKKRYAQLSGHGFKILGEAYEKDLPYEIKCPALLICGKEDKAGSARRYNELWHKNTQIPIQWIEHAGHNANTDCPEVINGFVEEFLKNIE